MFGYRKWTELNWRRAPRSHSQRWRLRDEVTSSSFPPFVSPRSLHSHKGQPWHKDGHEDELTVNSSNSTCQHFPRVEVSAVTEIAFIIIFILSSYLIQIFSAPTNSGDIKNAERKEIFPDNQKYRLATHDWCMCLIVWVTLHGLQRMRSFPWLLL